MTSLKREIKFDKSALFFLEDLTDILITKEYFSFTDTANKYVEDIVSFIIKNINTTKHKVAPPYFNKHGKDMYYITYHRNKNTTWYIFFERTKSHCLIKHISNNHVAGKYIK